MERYDEKAIDAVRDYLTYLLQKKEWCSAKMVGKALELLVDSTRTPSLQNRAPEPMQERCERG